MAIIDAHLHLVDPRFALRPSGIGNDWYLHHTLTADACVAQFDAAGVDGGIAVQAVGPYSEDWACAQDGARRYPGRLAWVGSGSRVDEMAEGGACGVRLFAVRERLDGLPSKRVFADAARCGLVLVATILPPDRDALGALAAAQPGLPVALDHCGFLAPHDLGPLASLPNVYLKVTTLALGEHPLAAWLDAVGPQRVLWGSDYPQTHDRSYAEALESAARQAEDAGVPGYLGANAARVFGLRLGAAPGSEGHGADDRT